MYDWQRPNEIGDLYRRAEDATHHALAVASGLIGRKTTGIMRMLLDSAIHIDGAAPRDEQIVNLVLREAHLACRIESGLANDWRDVHLAALNTIRAHLALEHGFIDDRRSLPVQAAQHYVLAMWHASQVIGGFTDRVLQLEGETFELGEKNPVRELIRRQITTPGGAWLMTEVINGIIILDRQGMSLHYARDTSGCISGGPVRH